VTEPKTRYVLNGPIKILGVTHEVETWMTLTNDGTHWVIGGRVSGPGLLNLFSRPGSPPGVPKSLLTVLPRKRSKTWSPAQRAVLRQVRLREFTTSAGV